MLRELRDHRPGLVNPIIQATSDMAERSPITSNGNTSATASLRFVPLCFGIVIGLVLKAPRNRLVGAELNEIFIRRSLIARVSPEVIIAPASADAVNISLHPDNKIRTPINQDVPVIGLRRMRQIGILGNEPDVSHLSSPSSLSAHRTRSSQWAPAFRPLP